MVWGTTERRLLLFVAIILATSLTLTSPIPSASQTETLPTLRVDANSTPAEVLVALPGLGPALAGRIVEARERSPFRTIDDLDVRVKGIGPAKVSAIRPFLRFDPISAPSR